MERVWLCGKMKKSRVAHNNLNLYQFMAILMSIKWSWTRRISWVFPIVCGHLTQIAVDFRSNFTPEPGKLHQIALFHSRWLDQPRKTMPEFFQLWSGLEVSNGFKYFRFKSVGMMISPTISPFFGDGWLVNTSAWDASGRSCWPPVATARRVTGN